MLKFKALLIAFDGQYVTDCYGETVDEVKFKLSNLGSKWFFYPIRFIIKNHPNVMMNQKIIDCNNNQDYFLVGSTVRTTINSKLSDLEPFRVVDSCEEMFNLTEGLSTEGIVHCPYGDLVNSFGEPYRFPAGDKIQCQWVIKHQATVIWIHDWSESVEPEGVSEWSIGCEPSSPAISLLKSWDFDAMTKQEYKKRVNVDAFADAPVPKQYVFKYTNFQITVEAYTEDDARALLLTHQPTKGIVVDIKVTGKLQDCFLKLVDVLS